VFLKALINSIASKAVMRFLKVKGSGKRLAVLE
jgi:hypothetical protein